MLLSLFGCSQKEPSVVETYEVADLELTKEYFKNDKLVTLVKYYEMKIHIITPLAVGNTAKGILSFLSIVFLCGKK